MSLFTNKAVSRVRYHVTISPTKNIRYSSELYSKEHHRTCDAMFDRSKRQPPNTSVLQWSENGTCVRICVTYDKLAWNEASNANKSTQRRKLRGDFALSAPRSPSVAELGCYLQTWQSKYMQPAPQCNRGNVPCLFSFMPFVPHKHWERGKHDDNKETMYVLWITAQVVCVWAGTAVSWNDSRKIFTSARNT